MAAIHLDDTPNGMRNDFEKAVAYLLPIADPTKKEGGRGGRKRQHGQVSQVIANLSVTKGDKIWRGTSGVKYCFHSRVEYQKLRDEEKSDLCQWRVDNPGLFSTEMRKGKRVTFEKGAGKGKGRILGNPDDTSNTRPDSKKENNARRSEIASAMKEQFALRDEQQQYYAKFESLIAGLLVNAEKKKPANIASGTGNVEDASAQLHALYNKMNAGRWNSAGPSLMSVSSTFGESNLDAGSDQVTKLDDATSAKICMIWSTCGGEDNKHETMTELDTHANMAIVGNQATVFHTGRIAEVRAFSDKVEKLESVPIFDAALAYDWPKYLKTYLLIVKNALHIPSMKHNMIPQFILREAGLEVNDIPRIHIRDEVTRESQSIIMTRVDLRIPLQLSGVFSYFESRSLTDREIEECDSMDIVLLTSDPKTWDPHCDSYADQDENFLDCRGDMKQQTKPKWRKIIDERDYINFSMHDGEYEASIDAVISANNCVPVSMKAPDHFLFMDSTIRFDDDPICASLLCANVCFDEELMAERMNNKLVQTKYATDIGNTDAANPQDGKVCKWFGYELDDPAYQ